MLAWGNLSLQLIFANLYGRSHQPTPLYLNIALIIGSMYSFILPN